MRLESLWGRMKVESESLIHQAQTLEELQQTIDERFEYYNRRRLHSSIASCGLVDLSTVVVAPTTCSLLLVLITCICVGFGTRIRLECVGFGTKSGAECVGFGTGKLSQITEACG